MRHHEPYYDDETNTWKVICKDDDGYYFNVIPNAGSKENAQRTAWALNREV